jgi:transposase
MGWIADLYAIDERAGNDAERRLELRRTESAAVLAKFKTWLWSQAVLKTLSIGKAAAYTIANWERLTRFVENSAVPLDNNGTERAIRGPVVGRKNHYGSKSKRGTEVAALFYSLLETAKLHNVTPRVTCAKRFAPLIAAKCCFLGSSPPPNILQRPARLLRPRPNFTTGQREM